MHDELLLKMLFWGAAGSDRSTLIRQLKVRQEESHDLMNYINEWQKNGVSFVDEYGALVLSYIQIRLEADLHWIESVITQLEGPAQLPVQDPKWLAVMQKARRTRALGGEYEEERVPGEQKETHQQPG